MKCYLVSYFFLFKIEEHPKFPTLQELTVIRTWLAQNEEAWSKIFFQYIVSWIFFVWPLQKQIKGMFFSINYCIG